MVVLPSTCRSGDRRLDSGWAFWQFPSHLTAVRGRQEASLTSFNTTQIWLRPNFPPSLLLQFAVCGSLKAPTADAQRRGVA